MLGHLRQEVLVADPPPRLEDAHDHRVDVVDTRLHHLRLAVVAPEQRTPIGHGRVGVRVE